MLEGVRHNRELLFDEETAHGGLYYAVLHDAGGGGVRAVSRAERVVHIDLRVVGKRLAERFVVLLFLPVEAEVFKEHGLALFKRVALGLCVGAYHVLCKGNFAAEQLVQPCRNGRKRKFCGLFLAGLGLYRLGGRLAGVYLFLVLFVELEFGGKYGVGLAQMRAERDFGAVFKQILYGGQRALYSVLVGDLPVLHGDVEVAAHEHLFAFKILEVFYRHFVHKNISP